MGEEPKESAEATSKYLKAWLGSGWIHNGRYAQLTRSRNALVGPRFVLRSRMIDSAPLKWLFKTVDEPERTIFKQVSKSFPNSTNSTYFVIEQKNDNRKDLISISFVVFMSDKAS